MKEHGKLTQGFYSDISVRIVENFKVKPIENGTSFLDKLK